MKKEVFLAITIGFILGLVITFGVWTANKSLRNLPQTTPTPTSTKTITTISPSPSPVPNSTLTIDSPIDEALLSTASTTLSGKATPNAAIAVISETTQFFVTADSSGNYTTSLDLEAGYNRISVTAVDPSGTSSSKSIVVTYSTTKI